MSCLIDDDQWMNEIFFLSFFFGILVKSLLVFNGVIGKAICSLSSFLTDWMIALVFSFDEIFNEWNSCKRIKFFLFFLTFDIYFARVLTEHCSLQQSILIFALNLSNFLETWVFWTLCMVFPKVFFKNPDPKIKSWRFLRKTTSMLRIFAHKLDKIRFYALNINYLLFLTTSSVIQIAQNTFKS